MKRFADPALLQILLNAVPLPIFFKDSELKYFGCNRAYEKVIGMEESLLIGKTAYDTAPKDLADVYTKMDKELLSSATDKQQYETKLMFADGSLHDVIFHKSVFRNNDGSVGGIIGVLLDVSERRHAEEHLLQFLRAVEHSANVVMIADLDGNIEYVNPKFTELTGYKFEEVRGKNLRFLKSGETSELEYKHLWQTLLSGGEWHGEFHNKKKNGEPYWESASISPIRDEKGKITHFVAIKEDITERKRVEGELVRLASFPLLNPNPVAEIDEGGIVTYLNPSARIHFPHLLAVGEAYSLMDNIEEIIKEARTSGEASIIREADVSGRVYEQRISYVPEIGRIRIYMTDVTERRKIDQLKSDFVSTVSHELRTPLSITKEGISLVLDKIAGEINDKQKHILTTANENINRLTRIINSLLDISKIESGIVIVKRDFVDIEKIIRDVADSFADKALEKSLELKVLLPNTGLRAYVDGDKIIQVLVNIVGNAVRFTDSGHIKISVSDQDSDILFSIEDTGAGIPRHSLVKLFNKFQQFGRVNGGGERGTGLGLAIAKGIVELHEGKIWAESEEGRGSTFHFRIPKLTHDEALSKLVSSEINAAQEHNLDVSLIVVPHIDSDWQKISKEKSEKHSETVKGIIRHYLRDKNDSVMELPDLFAAVLVGCDKQSLHQVINRLGRELEECTRTPEFAKKNLVLIGGATYPQDAKNENDLVALAKKDVRPWKPDSFDTAKDKFEKGKKNGHTKKDPDRRR